MKEKLRIIPWNEQTFILNGRREPLYILKYSTSEWKMTTQQKKENGVYKKKQKQIKQINN